MEAVPAKKQKQPFTRSRWYLLSVQFAVNVVIAIIVASFAVWLDNRSSMRWCDVVVTLDNAYHAAPPQTETGRKLASDMARLRRSLNC
jgi:hypothetical protein